MRRKLLLILLVAFLSIPAFSTDETPRDLEQFNQIAQQAAEEPVETAGKLASIAYSIYQQEISVSD